MKTIEAEVQSTAIEPVSGQALTRVELDTQIATAKNFPRDEERSFNKAMKLVRVVGTQDDAGLFYNIPRGKGIVGPSVRLAEIIQHCWGNSRAGARPINVGATHVTAQGVFHDLETNTQVMFETERKILDKDGHRYNDDMIGVTTNAAVAIAYRNAVLKGIPKVFWSPLYDEARKLAGGKTKKETEAKKINLVEILRGSGITPKMITAKFGVKDLKQLTSDQVADLAGIATAIKDGEITAARAFGVAEKQESAVKSKSVNANDHLTLDQQQDAMTLIQDRGYKTSDLPAALKSIG
ncbi:MAG TPA: hypothetical protein VET48_04485, partial [Steroidobacteraceae bacterium]|nr:hypothetical protein [Steroidobacteraceae bacterium]